MEPRGTVGLPRHNVELVIEINGPLSDEFDLDRAGHQAELFDAFNESIIDDKLSFREQILPIAPIPNAART